MFWKCRKIFSLVLAVNLIAGIFVFHTNAIATDDVPILFDGFDYPVETSLSTNNIKSNGWYEGCNAVAKEDPKNPLNNTAAYVTPTYNQYLGFGIRDNLQSRTVPAGAKVISGKVLICADTNKASAAIRIRGTSNGTSTSGTVITLLAFNGADSSIKFQNGSETVGTYKVDEWIKFSVVLMPDDGSPTSCNYAVYLSGGVANYYAKTGRFTKSSITNWGTQAQQVLFATTNTVSGSTGKVYYDDLKVSEIKSLYMDMDKKTEVSSSEPIAVNFNHDINLKTLTKENVHVTQVGGSEAEISSLTIDPLNPSRVIINFENELELASSYQITLDNTVKDIADYAVSNTIEFITEGPTGPIEPITKLTLNTPDNLIQTYSGIQAVNFTAATEPLTNIDINTIEWYVNDELQAATGRTFTYTPSGAGSYTVTAKVSDNADEIIDFKTIIVNLDVITNVTLNTSDILVQRYSEIKTVNFTAGTEPQTNVDFSTIQWYVNNELQQVTGKTFGYTPSEVGTYLVAVKISNNNDAQTDTKTIVVKHDDGTYDVITKLTLDMVGERFQTCESLSQIAFTATAEPNENVDFDTIYWYVNDVCTQVNGNSFHYTPTSAGIFNITAKISDNANAVTETKTIIVKRAPIISTSTTYLTDDCEGHTLGSKISSKWSVDGDVTSALSPVPADSTNKVIKFAGTNSSGISYPLIRKAAPMQTPVTIKGKLLKASETSNQFSLFIRDSVTTNNLRVLFMRSTANGMNVQIPNSYNFGKWKINEWIEFEVVIIPNLLDQSKSTVKVIMSGGVTNMAGEPAVIKAVRTIDLSSINLVDTMVELRCDIANKTGNAYLDDIEIQTAPMLELDIPSNKNVEIDGNITLAFNYPVEQTALTSDKISLVNHESDETVAIDTVTLDENGMLASIKPVSNLEEILNRL